MPLSDDQAGTIFRRTSDVISASVNGVLLIAAAQDSGVYRVPDGAALGLLWGVVMFAVDDPDGGGGGRVGAGGDLPRGHRAVVAGDLPDGVGAIVIGLIDNLLRPKLVGQRAKLHELIIFFAVLGGLQVFGVLGLFVGPVVAAIALALVEVFHGGTRRRKAFGVGSSVAAKGTGRRRRWWSPRRAWSWSAGRRNWLEALNRRTSRFRDRRAVPG